MPDRRRGPGRTIRVLSLRTFGFLAALAATLCLAASSSLRTAKGAAGAGQRQEGSDAPAVAADHEQATPPRQAWSFAGAFGRYDRAQLRRGFKVYREVCASCHSINLLAFRNLGEPGGPELTPGEVEALAASYKIKDGPNVAGDMFERPGRPSDRFPPPFPNEQAARVAFNGAHPPDMSVLAKARGYSRGFPRFLSDALPGLSYQEQGVDYIVALLGGYADAPNGVTLPTGQFYNIYMPARRIAMPPPLSDGQVSYDDGAPATAAQYAKDVAAFLMWSAEPHLEERKAVGAQVVSFLIVFAGLVYFTKRKIWASVEH